MAKSKPAFATASLQVEELSEDIKVAILEFLERYPGTSSEEIRQAMQLAERRTPEPPPP